MTNRPQQTQHTTSETTGSPPPHQVWAILEARDAPTLVTFLTDVLGFVRNLEIMDGERVAHAQLDWPEGGSVMLSTHSPEGEWVREPGSAGVHVATADPDALYARVARSGARIVRELADTAYGARGFVVADPEGNLWSVSTYRGEPRAS